MFDIGGWELVLIAVVAVLVIGPKELPATLRTLGRVVARLRSLSAGLRAQVDELIREAELDDVRKAAEAARTADFGRIVEDAIDPDRAVRDTLHDTAAAVNADAAKPDATAAPETPQAEPPK
jgi:sec-independent protein translocase protein TatB